MEEVITYSPDLSSIYRWLWISGIVMVIAILLAIRFLRPDPKKGKMNSLLFLLSGFTGLLTLTIFGFMIFNWVTTRPVELSATTLTIDGQSIPLNTIRRTQIHREGNGVPFQGIGVNTASNNSLIIEMSNGNAKILSEDFYPINEIAIKIKANKKMLKEKQR